MAQPKEFNKVSSCWIAKRKMLQMPKILPLVAIATAMLPRLISFHTLYRVTASKTAKNKSSATSATDMKARVSR
ncbi:hypothetical protein D3C75_1002720 [compost metagenome]